MPFIKGHKFYSGGEKGWFRKGVPSKIKGISIRKDNLCVKCREREIVKKTGSSYCSLCSALRQREWRKDNLLRSRQNVKNFRTKQRKIVFSHYEGKCACCGEGNYEFLTIDHVNKDGAKHRKIIGGGANIFFWLIKNNFPPGFQVLCFNCNMASFHHGTCPHKITKDGYNILTTHIEP